MGSKPSASSDAGDARGSQSGVVHPMEEDEWPSNAATRRLAPPSEEDLSSHEFARRMGMPGREEYAEMGREGHGYSADSTF